MDFDIIDPYWKNIYKEGFHLLFEKEQYPLSSKIAGKWVDEVAEAGFRVAEIYVKANAQKTASKGIKPELSKKEGLICASCYFVCKHNSHNPVEQSKWAKFFGISERTFDNRHKELKDLFYKEAQK